MDNKLEELIDKITSDNNIATTYKKRSTVAKIIMGILYVFSFVWILAVALITFLAPFLVLELMLEAFVMLL